MNSEETQNKKCFIGFSRDADWLEDLLTVCGTFLKDFDLELWSPIYYAD
jgi:hypothetical protein